MLPEDSIAKIRRTLRTQTHNSLLWLELARLHTIKGRTDKAERCILIATSMASQNRFVIRSAARFFIHVDQPDRAYAVVRAAAEKTNDPWILSTQINTAILAEKKPPKFLRFETEDIPSELLFHYSELLASIGIVELRFGSDKRAKKLFRNAWLDPSETVVANAEWVIRNRFPFLEQETKLDFSKSAEASSWHNFFGFDLSAAIDSARAWGLEEPYSTHPFTCGSSIACSARDFTSGADFSREGLLANSDDSVLLNNLAYSLLKQGAIREAERYMSKFPKNVTGIERAFLMATTGLYFFKTARPELGRKLYQDAYDFSKAQDDDRVAAKALLCLAEAEKELNSALASDAIKRALSESKDINEPSVVLLRELLKGQIEG